MRSPATLTYIFEAALHSAQTLTRRANEETSSFHVTRPQPLQKVTNLECVIQRATSVDTRDPIYKITVRLTLDDNLNAEDLAVIHHARSGATYNRADQYAGAQLSQVPGHTDYTWTGTLARNPSKLMKGRLVRTTDMRWAYFEQLFERGRLDYSMESVCHIAGEMPTLFQEEAQQAQRPSFSCDRVIQCPEKIICETPELGQLDNTMAGLYFLLQGAAAKPGVRALATSETGWLFAIVAVATLIAFADSMERA